MFPAKPPLWILVAVTATGPLALNLFIPSMPGLVSEFGADYATVQLTLTLYLAGVAVGQLVYGPLSDRFGRRPVLLLGLVAFVGAGVLAAVALSVEWLILGRVLQGVGGCAGMVLSRAIIRDVYDRDSAASALAYVTMAMAVAPAMGPAIGGLIDGFYGWRFGFVVVVAFGALALLGTWWRLPETNKTPIERIDVSGMLKTYGRLLRSVPFLGYSMNTALSICAFFSLLAGAPYVMIEILGHEPHVYGFYFVMVSCGYICGNFVAGLISKRLGVDRMIPLGVAVSTIGASAILGFSLAGIVSAEVIFFPFMVVAIGNGISQANGIAGAISVDPKVAGAASGLLGFMQMTIGGLGTILVGYFQDQTGHSAMAWMIFIATVLSFGAYWIAVTSSRPTGPSLHPAGAD